MSGTDGSSTPVLAGYREVEISGVESELASRIESLSSSGAPVSRSCALNLLVFIEDALEASEVSKIVDRVADAHPIRAIEMILDPRAPAEVRASVKLDCEREIADNRLCSEEIALIASPTASASLASAVRSLLSPDLPVALWWRGGSPFLTRIFRSVAPLLDKIVVDSIRFGDGPAALDTLHRLSEYHGASFALADMNWHRTMSWRTTLAACFDDVSVLALLPELDRSEIEFAVESSRVTAPPSARSALLAGWLVSRMPSMAGRGEIRAKPVGSATPGAIVGLRLFSSKSRAAVSIAWEGVEAGIASVAVSSTGETIRRWRFRADPEAEADLLYGCIESMARDPLLEAALWVD
jgi:glucose-6-phosphate dehydrogenase assembly protein OpcA